MVVTILDGDPREPGTLLDRVVQRVESEAQGRGDACTRIRLCELTLHQCAGCYDCWAKTPGRCRLRDEGPRMVAAAAAADLLVFAAPMRMGFTNALLKRGTDRLLPLLLPYTEVVDGEGRHPMRYGHGVDVALVLEPGDSSESEIAATEGIYRMLAKNLSGQLKWVIRAQESESRSVFHEMGPAGRVPARAAK